MDYITYNGPAKQFTYDYRGNMASDGLKNITLANYDRRNLPLQMTLGAANFYYNYDDGGNRINKKAGTTNEYYLRDHTGRELLVYDNNTGRLKMANIFGNGLVGRVDIDWQLVRVWDWEIAHWVFQWVRTDNRFYYLKDHLGSIRMTVNSAGAVVGYDDYYPFGKIMPNRSYVSSADYRFRFTSKERDVETGYDYFGRRYCDSDLGRWLSADPLADIYPGWSPYNYTLNNPLRFIDPDGSYVRDQIRGVYVYSRYSLAGAKNQLFWEQMPGVGAFAYLDRALINDTSFPTNNNDAFAQGLSFALSLTGAGTLSGFLTDVGISALGLTLNQDLNRGTEFALEKDKAVFEKALSTYVDGYPLAAKVGFDENFNPVEDPFGDGTRIMLHPLLRAYWQEQQKNDPEVKSPDSRFQQRLDEFKDEYYLENY